MIIVLIIFILGFVYTRLWGIDSTDTLSCGLCGYSGSKPVDPVKMNMLLLVNEARGKHSTGMYANNNRMLVKGVMEPAKFIVDKNYQSEVKGSTIVVGHTRFATTGAHTVKNAHPWRFGKKGRWQLIGAHNGWLFPTTLPALREKYNLDEKYEVDSQLIFDAIEKTGGFDCLKDIEGTMALSMVKDKTLYLYRRPSKPLYYGYADGGIYYSSIIEGLQFINAENIGKLRTDTMFEIKDGEMVNAYPIAKPKVTSLPEDVSPMSWRTHATPEEREAIPISLPVKKTETCEGECDTRSRGFSTQGNLGYRGNNEIYRKTLDDSKEITVTIKDHKHLDEISLLDQSTAVVIVNLINDVTMRPVMNWPVMSMINNTVSMTNLRGFVALTFDTESDCRIATKDPLTDKVYYSAIIQPKIGRVLEVTLNVPFRTSQEAKELNEDSSESTSGVSGNQAGEVAHTYPTGAGQQSFSNHGSEDTERTKEPEIHKPNRAGFEPEQPADSADEEQRESDDTPHWVDADYDYVEKYSNAEKLWGNLVDTTSFVKEAMDIDCSEFDMRQALSRALSTLEMVEVVIGDYIQTLDDMVEEEDDDEK